VKALPLVVPVGCTLSPGGLAAQKARAERLRTAALASLFGGGRER
jgi:hypothetical protein